MSLCVSSARLRQRKAVIEMNWNANRWCSPGIKDYGLRGDGLFFVIADESTVARLS